MMQQFIQSDEVIAFMSKIKGQKSKDDGKASSVQEKDLIEYIKYLVGEQANR